MVQVLLHLLQARVNAEWLEDKEDCIASIQLVRTKWSATTFSQSSSAPKMTGSCSAYGPLLESPISTTSG